MQLITYYVSSRGQVAGPFTQGQVQSQWDNGRIVADSQACIAGHDDCWVPVAELIEDWRPVSSQGRVTMRAEVKPARMTFWAFCGRLARLGCQLFICAIVFVCIASLFNGNSGGGGQLGYITGKSAIERWVRGHIADAKVVALSEAFDVGEFRFKRARISAHNAFGGPLLVEKIFPVDGSSLLGEPWDAITFDHWFKKELEKQPGGGTKLKAQVRAFVAGVMYEL